LRYNDVPVHQYETRSLLESLQHEQHEQHSSSEKEPNKGSRKRWETWASRSP
jgi:hypothetical protein